MINPITVYWLIELFIDISMSNSCFYPVSTPIFKSYKTYICYFVVIVLFSALLINLDASTSFKLFILLCPFVLSTYPFTLILYLSKTTILLERLKLYNPT